MVSYCKLHRKMLGQVVANDLFTGTKTNLEAYPLGISNEAKD